MENVYLCIGDEGVGVGVTGGGCVIEIKEDAGGGGGGLEDAEEVCRGWIGNWT